MSFVTRYYVNTDSGKRRLEEMEGRWKRFSKESRASIAGVDGQFDRSAGQMDQKSGWLTGKMKVAFAAVAAFIAARIVGALTRVTSALFEMGTNVEETESKFRTTFGAATSQVETYIEANRTMLALTRSGAQEMTATAGAIVQGMGASKEASAAFATEMVSLAGDLNSFHNVPIEESFRAIRSGLTGEMEPLKRFGIVLRDDEVKLRAVVEAQKRGIDASSQQAIAYARLALITEKAGVAVGDLARTQDSTQNTMRRLRAEVAQFAEDFSRRLLPAFRDAINYGKLLIGVYNGQADVLSGRLASAVTTGTQLLVEYIEHVRQLIGSIVDLGRVFGATDFTGGFDPIKRDLRQLRDLIDMVSIGLYTMQAAWYKWREVSAELFHSEEDVAKWRALREEAGEGARQIGIRRSRDGIVEANIASTREATRVAAELNTQLESLEQRFADHASGKTPLSAAELSDLKYEVEALGAEWRTVIKDADTAAESADMYADALRRLREVGKPPAPDTTDDDGAPPPGGDPESRALEIRQLAELSDAYGPYRDKLAEVHRVERELLNLHKLRKDATGDEAASLDALIAQREGVARAAREEAAALKQTGYVLEGLERAQSKALADPRMAIYLDTIKRATREYAEQLAMLENQRTSGLQSEEDHLQDVEHATESYLIRLRALYAQMVKLGLYSPELEAAFEEAYGAANKGADEAGDKAERLRTTLGSVASALRSLGTLGRVFGGMSREMQDLIGGTADVLDNLKQLSEVRKSLSAEGGAGLGSLTGIASQAVSVIGIASGVIGVVGGLIQSGKEQREEMRRLRESLRETGRAFKEAAERLFEGSVVGSDVSGESADRARGLTQYLRTLGMSYEDAFGSGALNFTQMSGSRISEYTKHFEAIRKRLTELEDLDIDFGRDLTDTFKDLVDHFGGDLGAALDALLNGNAALLGEEFTGLIDIVTNLEAALGRYGASVEGAVAAMQDYQRFFGATGEQALDKFVEYMLAVIGDEGPIAAALRQAKGFDLDTEEGRAQLRALVQSLFEQMEAGTLALGGLTPDEVRTIFETLFGLADGSTGADSGSAQSATFSRSITEVQANEMSRYLEGMYVTLLRIADALEAAEAAPPRVNLPAVTASTLAPGVASLLPRSFGPMSAQSVPDVSAAAATRIDVGGVSVTVRGGVDDPRRIAREIADEVFEAVYDQLRQEQATTNPHLLR